MGFRDRGVQIKTPEQIAKMRVAGLLVGQTLEVLRKSARPAQWEDQGFISLLHFSAG